MSKGSRNEGIRVDFIGDAGPFSRTGKSISYLLTVRGAEYLLDLGGPVFSVLGLKGISQIRGVFATHSHEDHRRWFTDVALFMFYSPHIHRRLRLITTETVHEEWEKNSKAALERSLSPDRKRIIEIPYEEFVEQVVLGPKAQYRIASVRPRGAKEGWTWRVVDPSGEPVGPLKAKVVVHPRANRPRLLFKDEVMNAWVEPESFYIYSDQRFYEAEQNPYVDEDAGLTVRPVKGPCWHGPPTFSVEFRTRRERLLFSSDTVYDPALWRALCEEHHAPRLGMTRRQFRNASLLYGDINNYVEYMWSRERYEEALRAYDEGIVVHDVDYDGSVVHTSYSKLAASGHRNLLLTHSPDTFVSRIPLAQEGKRFRVVDNALFEEVTAQGKRRLRRYDADLFVKRYADFLVGFKSANGPFRLIARDGRLDVVREAPPDVPVLGHYDLYVDINGRYFPVLNDPTRERYARRSDDRIEKVTETPQGSRGVVVKDRRSDLERQRRQGRE